ncbi:NinB family protein [Raoultella terrigena]|uniref:NinB family protein n=1 Tax=Raoultella terrigena TaxID=577 RepID=A0A7Z9CSA4_RAOTE|nr:NinB family protein [Raoultella terrigena]
MKQQFCLINDSVKQNAVNFIRSLQADRRFPVIIEAREESRTDKQNRMMWPLLKDLSDQVVLGMAKNSNLLSGKTSSPSW